MQITDCEYLCRVVQYLALFTRLFYSNIIMFLKMFTGSQHHNTEKWSHTKQARFIKKINNKQFQGFYQPELRYNYEAGHLIKTRRFKLSLKGQQ